jgi:hypothetical protein
LRQAIGTRDGASWGTGTIINNGIIAGGLDSGRGIDDAGDGRGHGQGGMNTGGMDTNSFNASSRRSNSDWLNAAEPAGVSRDDRRSLQQQARARQERAARPASCMPRDPSVPDMPSSGTSDDEEVRAGQREAGSQHGELHRAAAALPLLS